MNKYQNGKIYKLVCDNSPLIYYGSTTDALYRRLSKHRRQRTCSSKELFQLGNVSIHLVEEYPCNSKAELESRERIYIEFMLKNFDYKIICNERIPCRTSKEYYQDNKEEILKKTSLRASKNREKLNKYLKIYRVQNKECLRAKANEKINCNCGGKYTKANKQQHMKTKTHLEHVANQK